jgi:hypothetical protein
MTAAKKIIIDKNWMNEKPKSAPRSRQVARFEQVRIVRVDELPELISVKKAAAILGRHRKTVEEYRKDYEANGQGLKFIKVRGRYFTTPEWIHDFLMRESLKK